jgi:hypothetical protein
MSKAAELAALIGSQSSLSNRNLMINGAMNVSQRGTQTTIQSGYTLDRWSIQNNTAARMTVSQDTNVPTGQGFLNSLKIDVTTADTSVATSDIAWLAYRFEGQDLQQVRKGTSSAKTLTLQFWVSSPKTGIHTLHFYDLANARSVATTYTIASADTWQFVKVTFPADTTGSFDNDNTQQLQLYIGLLAGTNYTSGTLATSWAANVNANRMVGQVNVLDSTDNNFYITGVQMQLGDVATAFEHESFGDTLAKCQRYYSKVQYSNWSGRVQSGNAYYMHDGFRQTMRANPTASILSQSQSSFPTDRNFGDMTTEGVGTQCTASGNADGAYWYTGIALDAEL